MSNDKKVTCRERGEERRGGGGWEFVIHHTSLIEAQALMAIFVRGVIASI